MQNSASLAAPTKSDPIIQGRSRKTLPPTAAMLTALIVAGLVAALPLARFFDSIERWTQDLRFDMRGPITARTRIVIAELDEKSEQAWSQEPMVFWTGHYADMIRNAKAAGSRVIGFDIIPEVSGQRYLYAQTGIRRGDGPDARFAGAIQEAGDGMLVFAEQIYSDGPNGVYPRRQPIAPAEIYLEMPEVADNLGFTDLPAASDGVVRECFRSARAEDGGNPVPSFATLVAERAKKANVRLDTDSADVVSRWNDDPLPSFYVDYTQRRLPHVSAVDLATNVLTPAEREQLRDAIVLVGSTAPDGGDWHIGPNGRSYSGVELQGQAVATILDGRALHRLTPSMEAMATLLMGFAAAIVTAICVLGGDGRHTGKSVDAALLGLTALAWTIGAYALFLHARLLLPIVAPLLALSLPCLSLRAVHVATEWLRRTKLETQFGRYVTPEIRDYLLEHPNLQPEIRDVSVLFLDIRGSTAYAELRDPADVMQELNEMFQSIDGVLQRHHGLLYRYTGDGFLAVFGAPKPSRTHAADAVRCAIELLQQSERFNDRRAAEGRERWSIGCSVNSGRVAAGKLGTAERSEYTVTGDVVNLAAKIEAKNKTPDGKIFSDLVITDETLLRAPGADQTGDLLPVRSAADEAIKGRRETARLSFYRLVSDAL